MADPKPIDKLLHALNTGLHMNLILLTMIFDLLICVILSLIENLILFSFLIFEDFLFLRQILALTLVLFLLISVFFND
jgi:hypothetical protein